MQEEFIKEKENIRSLVPWTTIKNKSRCIGIYEFIPSSSGLRPLFIAKYINICLTNTPSVMFSYVLQKNINILLVKYIYIYNILGIILKKSTMILTLF